MEFNSERLHFREFGPNDHNIFSSVFSNDLVMKYAYMDKIADEAEMTLYFNQVIEHTINADKRDSYEFAVFLPSNVFIGVACILLHYHITRIKHGEIGYFLLPDHWGKGYATEIAEALTEVCFVDLHLHKVVASCNVNNPKSEKVMKKIGMLKEGELREERFKNGQWENELRYGILRGEWEERKRWGLRILMR